MNAHTATCDGCGYSKTSKTEPLARRGLTMHSCEKQRAKNAAKARRLARHAAVDKTPKPCLHKRARHVHGTHSCYVLDRCRCHPCTAANTDYERQRARLHAYGRFTHMVDASPVRDHIEYLKANGLGLKTVGKRAGISESTLGKLIYGDPRAGHKRSHRVRRDTADKILALQPSLDTLADGAKLDGAGTRRRLQALMAIGWSQSKLARAIGLEVRNFGFLVHGKRGVTAKTARAVRALYDELWNVEPPRVSVGDKGAHTRSLRYAARHGWVPPLAWDDDTIDDPTAEPHAPAGRAVNTGRPAEDIAEDVEWFLEDEPLATSRRVSDRLGIPANSIQIALKRAHRADLLDQLARNADLARPGQANRKDTAA